LHTIEVSRGQEDLFVTICFSTTDDLKKKSKSREGVLFRGHPLTSSSPLWEDGASSFALWEAALFPACGSRDESVKHALHLATTGQVPSPGPHGCCSMNDSLLLKNIPRMLAFRRQLELDIRSVLGE